MRPTILSNVLNQDPSQPFPEGQLPRSCTLGMASAHIWGINVREREEKRTPSSHSKSNFNTVISFWNHRERGTGFSAMPFPHTTHMGAGVAASSCSLDCMVWPLPWDAVVVACSRLTSALARHNSCPTSPSEHAERANLHDITKPTR